MRLSIVLACVLLLLPRPTISNEQSVQRQMAPEQMPPVFWSGNELWKDCSEYKKTGNSTPEGVICVMYIVGASQALLLGSMERTYRAQHETRPKLLATSCPGKSVNSQQIIDVVVKWFDDHPQRRDGLAPLLVADALAAAWPCQ